MPTKTKHDIATRTLRAMFWAYGGYVGGRLLTLAATAILARLLTPDDFGLVALALIAMAFLDVFTGLGVSDALVIVEEDEVGGVAETAFAINVVVGLVLACALAVLGPIAASFFEQPMLTELMPVLAISFFVLGLGNAHGALAKKRLEFRLLTAIELADATIRGAVGVILALAGAGVWSLVIGYVVGSTVWTVMLWLLVPWRPRFRPRRAHLRRLLTFGGTLTGIGLMAVFLTQFDNIVVGRVLGAEQLGFYAMATRIPFLFILGFAAVAGRVLFPAFAILKSGDVPRAFLSSLRYTSLFTLPLAVFLAVLAEPITIAVFGDRWVPAVEAMRVLCIWAAAGTFAQVCGNAFKGRGRPHLNLALAVPEATALVIGSLVFVDRGIVAVAWVQAVLVNCTLLALLMIAKSLFRLTFQSIFEAVRPTVFAATGLGVALVMVERTISSPWPAILAGAAVGAAVYFGLIILVAPDSLRALKLIARPAASELDHAAPQGPSDLTDEPPSYLT